MSSYALAIKLCDRLDNVCDMQKMKPDFIKKYVAETNAMMDTIDNGRKLTRTHKKLITMIRRELKKYKV